MEVAGNTPVLVSASQVVDRLDENWEKLGLQTWPPRQFLRCLHRQLLRILAHM